MSDLIRCCIGWTIRRPAIQACGPTSMGTLASQLFLIASPDRYEPRANDTVLDFARYYGTSVLAARPRTPRDKATAESSVQVVTRWVLARLRHHRFDTVAQVDAAITELLSSVNDRPFQKLPGSRASVFAELDAPTLMSLPRQPVPKCAGAGERR